MEKKALPGLGDRIREARHSLKMSQKTFAEGIRIKPNTVANYEIGYRVPSSAVLELLRVAYGISKDWLLTGQGEMFENEPPEIDPLQLLSRAYGLSQEETAVIKAFVTAPAPTRECLCTFMERAADLVRPPAPVDLPVEGAVDMVRRQFSEQERPVDISSQALQAG